MNDALHGGELGQRKRDLHRPWDLCGGTWAPS
jgi:hypothetical protein